MNNEERLKKALLPIYDKYDKLVEGGVFLSFKLETEELESGDIEITVYLKPVDHAKTIKIFLIYTAEGKIIGKKQKK